MRHNRQDRTKVVVCRAYERLRKRWQNLVDGNTGGNSPSQIEEATSVAHDKMVEHRSTCEECKSEDLALKEGNPAAVLGSQ